MIKILLVEDDKNIANTISYYLQSEGFTIQTGRIGITNIFNTITTNMALRNRDMFILSNLYCYSRCV